MIWMATRTRQFPGIDGTLGEIAQHLDTEDAWPQDAGAYSGLSRHLRISGRKKSGDGGVENSVLSAQTATFAIFCAPRLLLFLSLN